MGRKPGPLAEHARGPAPRRRGPFDSRHSTRTARAAPGRAGPGQVRHSRAGPDFTAASRRRRLPAATARPAAGWPPTTPPPTRAASRARPQPSRMRRPPTRGASRRRPRGCCWPGCPPRWWARCRRRRRRRPAAATRTTRRASRRRRRCRRGAAGPRRWSAGGVGARSESPARGALRVTGAGARSESPARGRAPSHRRGHALRVARRVTAWRSASCEHSARVDNPSRLSESECIRVAESSRRA